MIFYHRHISGIEKDFKDCEYSIRMHRETLERWADVPRRRDRIAEQEDLLRSLQIELAEAEAALAKSK